MQTAEEMFKNLGYSKYTSADTILFKKDFAEIYFCPETKTYETVMLRGTSSSPRYCALEVSVELHKAIKKQLEELDFITAPNTTCEYADDVWNKAYDTINALYMYGSDVLSNNGADETVFDAETVNALKQAKTALGAISQIRWERDLALDQLHKLGYELGEKIDE